ncbi:hypothetical protein ACYTTR_12995, partial [Cobetia marina]
EHNLAKVGVASSNLVSRSSRKVESHWVAIWSASPLESQSYRISFPAPVAHDVIDEIAVPHRLTDTIIVPRHRRFFCA